MEKKAEEEKCAGKPLSAEDIEKFERDGFVLLKNAFDPEIALACREQLWMRLMVDGILKDNEETWLERHGIAEIYDKSAGDPWDKVMSPKLKAAIDQVCGVDRWEKFGFGWWIITFPNIAKEPWGASGHWHIDGASYTHHIDSRESGLLPIFLFSDIGPGEGGTALCVGSHQIAAKILQSHVPHGMNGRKLSKAVHKEVSDFKIVEVNGQAGDVMLVHPFLLHARSKNLGKKGVDSVRFMCNPNVALHKRMELNRSNPDEYSPVEAAIFHAIQNDDTTSPTSEGTPKRKKQKCENS